LPPERKAVICNSEDNLNIRDHEGDITAMRRLIDKYIGKLEARGLARREDSTLIALDADMFSNRPLEGRFSVLERVFGLMNISSLLFARPAEPYWGVIREVLRHECGAAGPGCVAPLDCETRTFFHDIPVIDEFDPQAISRALSSRRSVIIRDLGVVASGPFTPEQAYVSFSSVCFSMYVKYFSDTLSRFEACAAEGRPIAEEDRSAFMKISRTALDAQPDSSEIALRQGPPRSEDEALEMLAEAGRAVVDRRLVDSYFGNISYVFGEKILISRTGSSMDELEGCVDILPLDGSSTAGITASSEFSAHKGVFLRTGKRAILHGHPKFSVIMSMRCDKKGCARTDCHRACPETRDIRGVPIVPGEIGVGPYGLVNTVPLAMSAGRGAIVYGHGVFTSGDDDFRGPFDMLAGIEERCRKAYFEAVSGLLIF
jgi:ribulose-5-phosphate 4-epimerase/fuculose-1-phosphate aldolase